MINRPQRAFIILNSRRILPGILFLLLLSSCSNDSKEISDLVSKNSLQEDRAEDVTIIFSQQGKVKARIFAHEFIRNETAKPPYTDMRKGLKAESFNDSAQVESTLTAKYARYYEKDGNILVRDSIVVVNKKGEKLTTEELVWNQRLQKLYTEKFVKIQTATQVIYGDGLEANQDFSRYEIKNIKGILRVNKSEVPTE
jgi:LPS export ABC transporter protein LptC